MYPDISQESARTGVDQNNEDQHTKQAAEETAAHAKRLQGARNIRCAIYARCASANPKSIACQIRVCNEEAQSKGWTVLAEYIKSDSGRSELHWAGLEGLDVLLAAVETETRPFDLLMVTNRSRLSRNPDAASKIIKAFGFYGVEIFSIEDREVIDGADELTLVFSTEHAE